MRRFGSPLFLLVSFLFAACLVFTYIDELSEVIFRKTRYYKSHRRYNKKGGTNPKRPNFNHDVHDKNSREKHTSIRTSNIDDNNLKRILTGQYNIISIQSIDIKDKDQSHQSAKVKYMKALYCDLNWETYKRDPARLPMFSTLVKISKCNRKKATKRFNFKEAVDYIRKYDSNRKVSHDENLLQHPTNSSKTFHVHNIEPTGFIFHEGRCGSTLAANMLVAMDPNITRMYSESQPISKILRPCVDQPPGECNRTETVELLHDAMYMMSRTNDEYESRLFFKFQPFSPEGMSLLREAFPNTPWIFIYRDPYEVMASNFQAPKKDFCAKSKEREVHATSLLELIKTHSKEFVGISNMTKHDYCAANMANFCEGAIIERKKSGTGKIINYSNLVEVMMKDIIPNYFNLPLGEDQRKRIEAITGVYSKGKGRRYREWEGDLERKNILLDDPDIISSVDLYMKKGYEYLETISEKVL